MKTTFTTALVLALSAMEPNSMVNGAELGAATPLTTFSKEAQRDWVAMTYMLGIASLKSDFYPHYASWATYDVQQGLFFKYMNDFKNDMKDVLPKESVDLMVEWAVYFSLALSYD